MSFVQYIIYYISLIIIVIDIKKWTCYYMFIFDFTSQPRKPQKSEIQKKELCYVQGSFKSKLEDTNFLFFLHIFISHNIVTYKHYYFFFFHHSTYIVHNYILLCTVQIYFAWIWILNWIKNREIHKNLYFFKIIMICMIQQIHHHRTTILSFITLQFSNISNPKIPISIHSSFIHLLKISLTVNSHWKIRIIQKEDWIKLRLDEQ